MSLKLVYLGQNDSVNCTPNVVLTGDPGTDQQTLALGNYVGGVIVALQTPISGVSPNQPAFGVIGAIMPCDTDSMVPFATLLNNGGEFAGAIGPSGSKKQPVVRAMWQGIVGNSDGKCYDTSVTFTLGGFLYCGHTTTDNNVGQYTTKAKSNASYIVVGICTHVPTTPEPWLGVASLL
jgi:hypothetical protein